VQCGAVLVTTLELQSRGFGFDWFQFHVTNDHDHLHLCLPQSRINWHWPKGGDALQLGSNCMSGGEYGQPLSGLLLGISFLQTVNLCTDVKCFYFCS